eukprot:scaffold138842_cov14-Tisochrysis_lutea.AAC.1
MATGTSSERVRGFLFKGHYACSIWKRSSKSTTPNTGNTSSCAGRGGSLCQFGPMCLLLIDAVE